MNIFNSFKNVFWDTFYNRKKFKTNITYYRFKIDNIIYTIYDPCKQQTENGLALITPFSMGIKQCWLWRLLILDFNWNLSFKKSLQESYSSLEKYLNVIDGILPVDDSQLNKSCADKIWLSLPDCRLALDCDSQAITTKLFHEL